MLEYKARRYLGHRNCWPQLRSIHTDVRHTVRLKMFRIANMWHIDVAVALRAAFRDARHARM